FYAVWYLRKCCRVIFRPVASASLTGFFFIIIRPPPSSTLFPYTTLFRSTRRFQPRELVFETTRLAQLRVADVRACEHIGNSKLRDRKSTRLNSSHVSISYAVFCLKKKMQYAFDNNTLLQVRK